MSSRIVDAGSADGSAAAANPRGRYVKEDNIVDLSKAEEILKAVFKREFPGAGR